MNLMDIMDIMDMMDMMEILDVLNIMDITDIVENVYIRKHVVRWAGWASPDTPRILCKAKLRQVEVSYMQ